MLSQRLPWLTCESVLSEAAVILPEVVLVTTEADFRIYRRHMRQVVPCLLP